MEASKKEELRAFLFITVFLFPILSIAIVGGLGFAIWFSQMIFGPPGI
jgi:nitrate reductase NapE